ncbi:hypothetical protein FJT64_021072 [Amphibalanus amphitrite]|uniref:Uncharacterized protein n=1 Tax=Amphibalanus amphitrite TaxID=1232801 RepID=A0A6A4WZI4_AMPAM|nr:hypothetical protein FJT64_021072 [Amphibalanus amphitrite]
MYVVLAVLGTAAAMEIRKAEDQKAEDAHPYPRPSFPLTYPSSRVPFVADAGYHAPAVYSAGYSPLAYNGFYNGVYHGYTAPVVHSLKKRDVSDAEGQQADEATYVSTYAAHPYSPLTYTAGYPYRAVTYSGLSMRPPAYSSRAPLVYATPLAPKAP